MLQVLKEKRESKGSATNCEYICKYTGEGARNKFMSQEIKFFNIVSKIHQRLAYVVC